MPSSVVVVTAALSTSVDAFVPWEGCEVAKRVRTETVTCDRCHKAEPDLGSRQVYDLAIGPSDPMTQERWVRWDRWDLCGPCAREVDRALHSMLGAGANKLGGQPVGGGLEVKVSGTTVGTVFSDATLPGT